MYGISDIFKEGRPIGDIIADLKDKQIEIPDWDSELLKLYEPTKHKIVTDTETRKDKIHKNGQKDIASRIYIGWEQLLVKRMTEFTCAIPIKRVYHNTEDSEVRQQIAQAKERIYKYARIDAENVRRLHAYYAGCEIFTIWYVEKKQNTLYGFNCPYKLKCRTYSPMDRVKLYPLFDDRGDMIAMSFAYETKRGTLKTYYFETFTADKHYKWVQENGEYKAVNDPENIEILKIPGAYMWRPQPVYHGLSHIREEAEYTLSRNSDVIAYNSAPILKVSGELAGQEEKGASKRVYRVENGGDVSYVSWSQAIEALKYQVDMLTNLFWTQSQMPDISFANMKSLGNIGFDARQTLLTDAHLKIGDESCAIYEFLDRESNVINAFLKKMNTAWASEVDNIETEHIITPFIQNDEKAEIGKWMEASGGKPVISQLDAIKLSGLSSDPQKTLEQIQAEESTSAMQMNSVFESGM